MAGPDNFRMAPFLWEQAAAQKLIDSIAARNPASTALVDKLKGVDTHTLGLGAIATKLAEELKNPDPIARQDAAWAFGKAAEFFGQKSLINESAGSLISDPVDALQLFIGQLVNEEVPFRRAIAEVVGDLINAVPNQQALNLLRIVIGQPSRTFVAAVLMKCRGEIAFDAFDDLVKLLEDETKEVQLAACRLLGGLGDSGYRALPELLAVAAGEPKKPKPEQSRPKRSEYEEVQAAAAEAVALIDPLGEYILSSTKIDSRDHLLRLLRKGGQESGTLYGILDRAWNKADLAGPPAGYRRLAMKEIIAFVFGMPPNGQNAKAWKDNLDEKIRGWMESRQLRATRVRKGMYDVNLDDLAGVKRQVSSGSEDEP